MKYLPIILALIFLRLTGFGQLKANGYKLTIDFSPSLMLNGKLTIYTIDDSAKIEFRIYKANHDTVSDDTAWINRTDILELTNFLKTYDRIQSTKRINKSNSKKRKYLITVTPFDGIYVAGELEWNQVKRAFAFSSLKKASGDGTLVTILFSLMKKEFPYNKPFGYQTYSYIKELEKYFE